MIKMTPSGGAPQGRKEMNRFWGLQGPCYGLGTNVTQHAKPVVPVDHVMSSGTGWAVGKGLGWEGKSHSRAVFRGKGPQTKQQVSPLRYWPELEPVWIGRLKR